MASLAATAAPACSEGGALIRPAIDWWSRGSEGGADSQGPGVWTSVSQSVSDKPLCVSLTSCQLRITAGWRLLWAVANKRRTWCKQSHHSRLCVCVYMYKENHCVYVSFCWSNYRNYCLCNLTEKDEKKNLFTEEITWTWLLFHFSSGNYVGNPHNWYTWVMYWCQYMLCTVQYTYSSHYRGGVEPTT